MLIISLRLSFDVVNEINNIFKIAHLLLIKYYELSSTFSDVCIAYMLLLTYIASDCAISERSFSKLLETRLCVSR